MSEEPTDLELAASAFAELARLYAFRGRRLDREYAESRQRAAAPGANWMKDRGRNPGQRRTSRRDPWGSRADRRASAAEDRFVFISHHEWCEVIRELRTMRKDVAT